MSRAVVQTYVPTYQKEEWKRHADDLDMTQSEFVRTMVQAGRRGFGGSGEGERTAEEDDSGTPDPGGSTSDDGVRDHVLAALSESGALDWDQLAAQVTEHVERDLEAALDELQASNQVKYSGREGGYTLVEDR